MTDLRTAAQQMMDVLDSFHADLRWELDAPSLKLLRQAEGDLRVALSQPEDKSQAAFEHWVETVEATQKPEQSIIQPEIKVDKETRWLPMPWKGLTEEEHNYYKALGFVGVKAVEEKLRAKNSTLVCIPAVPPGL